MDKGINICISLHTSIGKQDNIYYIKDLLNEYFVGLSKYVNITLLGTVQSKQFFHNSVVPDRINLKLLTVEENKNIIKKFGKYYSLIRQSDFCFLFMPSMSSFFAGAICKFLSKRYVSYFGANWQDLELAKSNKSIFKALCYRAISNFISMNSVFSLHAGLDVLNKHRGKNKNLTIPILIFSKDNFYIRSYYKDLTQAQVINVLYVGTLSKNKGIDILLHTVKEINIPQLHITIIGGGPEKAELELLIAKLGLTDKVIFGGFVKNGPELFTVYKNHDIFILPSFSEGLPRVLYEAAGNGCTIITTPVNSIKYLFTDNHDCLFIKPGDENSIIEAINRLITEKGLNEFLSRNAYNTIRPMFQEKAFEQHFRLMKEFVL